jgi:hypothetical protein
VKISNESRQLAFPDYVKEGLRTSAPPDRPSTLTLKSVMTNHDPYRPAGGLRDAVQAFDVMQVTRSLILKAK